MHGEDTDIDLRVAVQNMQPPADAHEIWKHGFLVACQAVVALIDAQAPPPTEEPCPRCDGARVVTMRGGVFDCPKCSRVDTGCVVPDATEEPCPDCDDTGEQIDDRNCDCFIPSLEGAGQHSPGCACFQPCPCGSGRRPVEKGTP